MLKCYKYKYYLNASHSFNYKKEAAHSHTFVITLYIEVIHEKDFTSFMQIERFLEEYFDTYRGQYLNECGRFVSLNPTVENIGDSFYEELKAILKKKQLNLIQLEICENPIRVYAISDRIIMSSEYLADNRKRWEAILAKKQRTIAMLKGEKERVRNEK